MYLVRPLAQADRCLTFTVGQNALHQIGQFCGKMSDEAMLLEKSGAVPDGVGMPLDEDRAVLGLNYAGRGKWPRAHGGNAYRAASLRIAAQQRVHLGQR